MKPILISLIYYLFILALPSSVHSSPVPAEPEGAAPPPEAASGPTRRSTRRTAAAAAGGGASSLQVPGVDPAPGRNLRSSKSSTQLQPSNPDPDPGPSTNAGGRVKKQRSTSNLPGKPYSRSPAVSRPGSKANTPKVPGTPLQELIMGTGNEPLETSVPQASHDLLRVTPDALDKACQEIQREVADFIKKFHNNCIRQGNDVCNPDERGLTNRLYMAITDNNAGYMPPDSAGEATTGADSYHAIRFIGDDGAEVLSYWQAKLLKFPNKDDLQNGKGVIEFTQKYLTEYFKKFASEMNANNLQMLLLDAKVREERAKYKKTVAVAAFYIIYTSTEVFAVPNSYVLTWCAGAKKLADCKKDRVQPKRKMTDEVMEKYAKKDKCFLKYILEYVRNGGRDPLNLGALVAALPGQADPSSGAGPSGLASSSGASGPS
ncbi:hypothetical protein FRC17_000316 [Serendipita sp. 399]|nr:hypothetical protein FRC17_000316 [Serendipita sp. 399]